MDSKLKRKAVFVGFAVIFMVAVIVILANYRDFYAYINRIAAKETQQGQVSQNGAPEEGLHDFMKDSTFFNQEEKDSSPLTSESGGHVLDLMVTSVEKDLRVKIVDLTGQPVPGEDFFIQLEGQGEYQDVDQDGIVYIGDLAAGDYYVSLKELPDYRIPSTRVRVAVKDKVEYTVIDDISYLIKSEDQVNANAEDTEVNDAEQEADGSEIQTPVTAESSEFGIDVSKWNKEIDWQRVKEAGVKFAIIRCGYRGSLTGSLVEDPYFIKNIEGASAAGIKVGIYFFTQAVTEVEAVEEASMAIALSREYKLDYPIFIDTEGAGGNGRADALNRETRTAVCEAFCETIKSAGYTPGVYASKNWFLNHLSVENLGGYAVWLAEYREEPSYTGDFHMWQYTSNGSIDGINGRVDLNLSLLR